LESGFFPIIRKRAGWLSLLLLGQMLTVAAMSYFEGEIERAVVLALFIPLVISSGGNSGSQATSLIIRAMALGEVSKRHWLRVLRRELATGLTLGGLLAVIVLLRMFLLPTEQEMSPEHARLVATVAFSVVGVVTFGTVIGSMLPFALEKFGLDPAAASAPLVATVVDVTGLFIYFTIALMLLRGTLL
jgi:magnesium transporter